MESAESSERVTPSERRLNITVDLNYQGFLLASGLTAGFLIGWFTRSRRFTSSKRNSGGYFSRIAAVGKYAVSHGKIPQTKLALVVRNDLELTRGKAAAQCGHAAVGTVHNFTGRDKKLMDVWLATGQTKVVLKVDSEAELIRLEQQAVTSGVGSFLVRDAGRTEVETGTATALAVGPADVKDVDAITGKLKLL